MALFQADKNALGVLGSIEASKLIVAKKGIRGYLEGAVDSMREFGCPGFIDGNFVLLSAVFG